MKKIVYSFVLSVGLLAASCTAYLEEDNRSGADYSFLRTAVGFETAVNAAYETMRWGVGGERWYCLTEYGCDWTWEGADGSKKDPFNKYLSTLSSSEGLLYEFWENHYKGITRVNTALMILPEVTDMGDATKSQREAELKFMRAFFYFDLVRQFGGVPLELIGNSGQIVTDFKRASVAEVYDQIIKDLTDAYAVLPDAQHNAQRGRGTKWATAHLLASVYLTRGSAVEEQRGQKADDMTKALQYAEQVINSGKFALEADYATYFEQSKQNASKEIVWDVQFIAGETPAVYNGPDGNKMHLYYSTLYDTQPGMTRDGIYGRPWRRIRGSHYAFMDGHLWNHHNDSRFFKTFQWMMRSNNATSAANYLWREIYYYDKGNNPQDVIYDPGPLKGQPRFAAGDTSLLWVPKHWGSTDDNNTIIDESKSRQRQIAKADKPYNVFFIDDYTTNIFPQITKWLDFTRGANINYEQGSRNWIRMRLGETYLIAAEAAGRTGDMTKAAQYINEIRKRAAYKQGETKDNLFVNWLGLDPAKVNESTEAAMTVTESDIQKPTFVDFILEERSRELFAEMYRWLDLTRTEKLYERLTKGVPGPDGTIIAAPNKESKPNIKPYHNLRPIPQNHIDRLSPKPKLEEVQNPGYF